MNPGYDMSLDELKDYNKAAVLETRATRLNAGFPFNGHMYDSIIQERNNIIGVCTLALATILQGKQFPDNFTWRTQENVNVPHTAASIIDLGVTMFGFISTCYEVSWAHKAAIDAFTEEQYEDLLNYDITVNWPA